MTAPVLQFKRGALANLPGLRAGEPALTTDGYDFYVGINSTTNGNKFFGSHRYWTKETTSVGSSVKVVEGTNNGSNSIALKSPDTLAGDLTYTLPGTQGAPGNILSNDGSGVLSWSNSITNPSFSGITTFTDTTDSTVYTNGAVQIRGGLGVSKSVNVGANLYVTGVSTFNGLVIDNNGLTVNGDGIQTTYLGVGTTADIGGDLIIDGVLRADGQALIQGITTIVSSVDSTAYNNGGLVLGGGLGVEKSVNINGNLSVAGVSTFVGNVTFQGGTINLGDSNTDNVVFAADVNSDILPNTDATYNLGAAGKRWKDAVFSGIITASSFVGSITGAASTATTVNTTADSTNSDFYVPFVTNSTSTTGETIRVDAGLKFNPSNNNLTVDGDLRINGNDILASDGNSNITLTSNTLTTFAGDIKVVGNDIQASDGNTNITLTSNTLTAFAGDIRVNGNDIQASDGNNNITLTSNTLTTFAGDIRVGGNDIQASDGTTAITLSAGTGNVGISSNLTVTGNLYVLGATTEVETTNLKVADTLVDLGLVQSGTVLVPPSTDLNIDIGVLFNWYNGAAKKAAVYWDDSARRIGISSDISESNSVLTSNAYAEVEIGALWVTDCAGTSQVISCAAGERTLANITVDAGTF